jgi:hypothetical protein
MKGKTMRFKPNVITPLLATAAAVVAIAAAPTAAAAPTCFNLGDSETMCQSPGNVQINNARPFTRRLSIRTLAA